jgi:predicted DNA-binding antitoxin AbrB/MazE fold protein
LRAGVRGEGGGVGGGEPSLGKGAGQAAQFTEAIYTNGVLKPKENLALHEAQRVRLIIEPLDDDSVPAELVERPPR